MPSSDGPQVCQALSLTCRPSVGSLLWILCHTWTSKVPTTKKHGFWKESAILATVEVQILLI